MLHKANFIWGDIIISSFAPNGLSFAQIIDMLYHINRGWAMISIMTRSSGSKLHSF